MASVHAARLVCLVVLTSISTSNQASLSDRHAACSNGDYYVVHQDICLERCGSNICQPRQICSLYVEGYKGAAVCRERCYKPCGDLHYCNRQTQSCDPCSGICIGSTRDSLYNCRKHCYGVYIEMRKVTSPQDELPTTQQQTTSYRQEQTTQDPPTQLGYGVITGIVIASLVLAAGVTAVVVVGVSKRRTNDKSKTDSTEQQHLNRAESAECTVTSNSPDVESSANQRQYSFSQAHSGTTKGSTILSEYRKDLCNYYKNRLGIMMESSRQQGEEYIDVGIYKRQRKSAIKAQLPSRQEHIISTEADTEKIKLSELFQRKDGDEENPSLVLMHGMPGVGKTRTCLRVLENSIGIHDKEETIPFFISLNDITDESISLKMLFMTRIGTDGESHEKRDLIWNELIKNDGKILVIMDGGDECPVDFVSDNVTTVTSTIIETNTGVILKSLICRRLLSRARILLASRSTSVIPIWSKAHRIVQLGLFTSENVKTIFKNTSALHLLNSSEELLSYATLPVHAYGIVDISEYLKVTDYHPTSRTELFSALTSTELVKNSKKHSIAVDDVFSTFRTFNKPLRQLAVFATSEWGKGKLKVIFTQDELTKGGVDHEALNCGFIVPLDRESRPIHGKDHDAAYIVPYLLTLEYLAGFGLTQNKELCKKVGTKNNLHDTVLTTAVGLMGNKRFHPLLENVFSEVSDGDYTARAGDLVMSIVTGPRRHTLGGEMFVTQAMFESSLWDKAPLLQRSLTGICGCDMSHEAVETENDKTSATTTDQEMAGALVLKTSFHSIGDLEAITDFIHHVETPFSAVHYRGDVRGKDLTCLAKSKSSICLYNTKITADELSTCAGLDELRGLGLCSARITASSLIEIVEELESRAQNLEGLYLYGNPPGSDEYPDLLRSVKKYRYLSLSDCHLKNKALETLLTTDPPRDLRHLDVSNNQLTPMTSLANFISWPDSPLQGLNIDGCEISGLEALIEALRKSKSLKSLSMSDIKVLTKEISKELGCLLIKEHSALVDLSIAGSNLNIAAFLTTILGQNKKIQVESLDLSYNTIQEADIALVKKLLERSASLRHLALEEVGLRDDYIEDIASSLIQLKTLNICRNRYITIDSITRVISSSHLSQLWVARCGLTSADYVNLFSAISEHHSIKWLVTGEYDKPVNMHRGLEKLARPLEKMILVCREEQRESLSTAIVKLEDRLKAPAMCICYSFHHSWTLYRSQSGTHCYHLPENIRALFIRPPQWHSKEENDTLP